MLRNNIRNVINIYIKTLLCSTWRNEPGLNIVLDGIERDRMVQHEMGRLKWYIGLISTPLQSTGTLPAQNK